MTNEIRREDRNDSGDDWDDLSHWFVATPTPSDHLTGTWTFDYGGSDTDNGVDDRSQTLTITEFNFDVDFSTADIYDGVLNFEAGSGATDIWNLTFGGSVGNSTGEVNTTSGLFNLATSGSVAFYAADTENVSGRIAGAFTGSDDSAPQAVVAAFAVSQDGSDEDAWASGTLTASRDDGVADAGLSTPRVTTDSHSIGWGDWDNPIEDNWVVVNSQPDGEVQIQTDDYLATVNPTPVANLTGAATYGSTLASDFIGSGSAGDVTQLVAGMNVDFNTGMIANGSLQVEVAGAQAWEIDFAGTINGGDVSLNSLGGTLMDPGGLVSSSINANLDGVFTGNNAEAFVGGFDMVDEINAMNHVNGLYTIEK